MASLKIANFINMKTFDAIQEKLCDRLQIKRHNALLTIFSEKKHLLLIFGNKDQLTRTTAVAVNGD